MTFKSVQGSVIDYVCDILLGLYGSCPVPHRGRDRIVTLLRPRAQRRWTGPRAITRRGRRIETDLSVDDVGQILYAYGCLDFFDERAVCEIVARGSVCLDIGAHIGYYSLLLSRCVGSAGHIFSYEPVPYTYSFLMRNLERNRAVNVSAEQVAVGDRVQSVRMSIGNSRLGWSSVSDSGNLEARSITVDSEVSRLNLGRLDFMKLDVEGYEAQALIGADSAVRRFRPRIMFEVNPRALKEHGSSLATLQDFFKSRSYRLFRAGRGGLRPVSGIAGPSSYSNVFAVPD